MPYIPVRTEEGRVQEEKKKLAETQKAFGEQLEASKSTAPKAEVVQADASKVADVNVTDIKAPTQIKADQIGDLTNKPTFTTITAPKVDQTKIAAPIDLGVRAADITDKAGSIKSAELAFGQAQTQSGIDLQRQAATGAAPSVAELQLKQGQEELIKQQQAALAGRAYDPAAMRQVQQQTAEAGQKLNQQQAVVRAGEMATAREQLTQANLQATNQIMNMNAQEVQNKIATLSADQNAFIQQRAQELQAKGIDKDTALKTALADQDVGARTAMANQAAQVATTTSATQFELEQKKANQAANIEAAKANLSAETQIALSNADNNLRAQLANQGVDLEIVKQNAAAGNNAAIANLDAALKTQGMNDDMIKAYMQATLGLSAQEVELAKTQLQGDIATRQTKLQGETQREAAIIGTLGSVGGALSGIFSDPKTKKGMKQADDKLVEEFLGDLGAYVFEYKDDMNGKGPHLGVNADELANSKFGGQLVKEEEGLKKVDVSQAFGGLLAAAINANKRLNKLEKK